MKQIDQIDELRQILNGDNAEDIAALKRRLENIEERTKDVAEVLAPAINTGLRENDSLVNALKQPVSKGLKQAIRSEPDVYAEILYPAIAPSIRRAISQSLSSLLITINRSVESATSFEGLKTRLESLTTGVPYAELVLRKSLLYRVEHLYLVDRASGLRIADCAIENSSAIDSDAVSGMFSAIQSFVQDSFSAEESDRLTDFKVGDNSVWIAHGPRLMLACVVRGNPPESLKAQLYDTLDLIKVNYANEIIEFDGDSSKFIGIEQYLSPMLQARTRDGDDSTQALAKPKSLVTKFVYLALLFLLGYLAYLQFVKSSKIDTVKHYLSQTPGIVVTDIYWQNAKLVVEGLKDPLAKLPLSILKSSNIAADQLVLKTSPYISLDPKFETQRFRQTTNLPDSVDMFFEESIMHLRGQVTEDWYQKNRTFIDGYVSAGRLNIDQLSIAKAQ